MTGLTENIEIQADLAEVGGSLDKLDEKTIRRIEKTLADRITREAVQVLREERKLGDFLHLKRTLMAQYPTKAGLLRDHWREWRKDLTIQVKTTCVIQQSFDVSRGTEQSE